MEAKKLFALASVTALAGFVASVMIAGCSSTESVTVPIDSGAKGGSKTDARRGPSSGPQGDDDDTTQSCLDTTPIDQTKYEYEPSTTPTKGLCSTEELSALSAYYKAHGSEKDFDATNWMAAVSGTCAECVFTTRPDDGGHASTWTPIVLRWNDTKLEIDTIDRGGCIEAVSGSLPCGRAYQQYDDCTLDACLKKCTTQTAFSACRQDATVLTTACKAAIDAVKTACGEKNIAGYETACKGTTYTFEGPIKVLCVNGVTRPSDAGADATVDADH